MQPNHPDWFKLAGQCAKSVGTDQFYSRLLDVFKSVVAHDMAMALRYSRFAAPDFLVWTGVSQEIIDIYLTGFYRFDPFYQYWRECGVCGVVPVDKAASPSDYNSIFQPVAKIADEIGVFLPGANGSSIALFVERSAGKFTAAETSRIRLIYPLLSGLHEAHFRSVFASLGSKIAAQLQPTRPMMMVDRNGHRVFANAEWRKAEEDQPNIEKQLGAFLTDTQMQVYRPDGNILHIETLQKDFPLAPEGRLFVIEKPGLKPISDPRILGEALSEWNLTDRQADIVKLILRGYPNSMISRKLQISTGTLKNHRRRIYCKLDITTERELFLRYLQSLERVESGHAAEYGIPRPFVSAGP